MNPTGITQEDDRYESKMISNNSQCDFEMTVYKSKGDSLPISHTSYVQEELHKYKSKNSSDRLVVFCFGQSYVNAFAPGSPRKLMLKNKETFDKVKALFEQNPGWLRKKPKCIIELEHETGARAYLNPELYGSWTIETDSFIIHNDRFGYGNYDLFDVKFHDKSRLLMIIVDPSVFENPNATKGSQWSQSRYKDDSSSISYTNYISEKLHKYRPRQEIKQASHMVPVYEKIHYTTAASLIQQYMSKGNSLPISHTSYDPKDLHKYMSKDDSSPISHTSSSSCNGNETTCPRDLHKYMSGERRPADQVSATMSVPLPCMLVQQTRS